MNSLFQYLSRVRVRKKLKREMYGFSFEIEIKGVRLSVNLALEYRVSISPQKPVDNTLSLMIESRFVVKF